MKQHGEETIQAQDTTFLPNYQSINTLNHDGSLHQCAEELKPLASPLASDGEQAFLKNDFRSFHDYINVSLLEDQCAAHKWVKTYGIMHKFYYAIINDYGNIIKITKF